MVVLDLIPNIHFKQNCFDHPSGSNITSKNKLIAMNFPGRIIDYLVRIFPIMGTFLFAYSVYLQFTLSKDLLSAFSLAVFLVFLLSVASVSYGYSARSRPEKEKARALWFIGLLFCLVALGFLFRAWIVLPAERRWVVPTSCAIPALAPFGFFFILRRL